jgi:NAD(P)-dependent dehydrogenase (short-subunit alcohol dehydrogenase family)
MQRNGSSAPAEVVVLTGAASGVGLATAGRLGIDGAGLALVDDGDALALARRSLEGDGAAVIAAIEGDASDATTAVRAIEGAEAGEHALSAPVNSAAIVTRGCLSDLSLAQRSRIFEVNVHGTFLMMTGASEAMLPRGWARRVNGVAPVDGAVTEPNLAAYGATKDAVVQLTHPAAVDHAQAGLHIAASVLKRSTRHSFAASPTPYPPVSVSSRAAPPVTGVAGYCSPTMSPRRLSSSSTRRQTPFVGSSQVVGDGVIAT